MGKHILEDASSGSFIVGTRSTSNIVADTHTYNNLSNTFFNTSDRYTRHLYDSLREVETITKTSLLMPRTVEKLNLLRQILSNLLTQTIDINNQIPHAMKAYASSITSIGGGSPGSNIDLVWNAGDAAIVREDINQAYNQQVGYMRETVSHHQKTIQRLDEEIRRQQSIAENAMKTIAVTNTGTNWTTDADGNDYSYDYEYQADKEVADEEARAVARATITELTQRQTTLRAAIVNINEGLDTFAIDRAKLNAFFEETQQELHRADKEGANNIYNLNMELERLMHATDQVSGAFVELPGGGMRMNVLPLATLARGLNIPTTDSINHQATIEELVAGILSGDIVLVANSSVFSEEQWAAIAYLLAKGYDDLDIKDFANLAVLFGSIPNGYISDLERFLNKFLSPVKLPPGTYNPFGLTAYAVCGNKLAGVQHFMRANIDGLGQAMRDLHTSDDIRNDLRKNREHYIQLYALLGIIGSLTTKDPGWDHNARHQKLGLGQNIILGVGSGSVIKLEQGDPSGERYNLNVIVNRGSINSELMHGQSPSVNVNPHNLNMPRHHSDLIGHNSSHVASSTIVISPVFNGAGISVENTAGHTGFLYSRYQFVSNNPFPGITTSLLLGLATKGMAPLLAVITSYSVDGLQDIKGLFSNTNTANNVRRDISSLELISRYGDFQRDFAMTGVVISESGRPPQAVNFPTENTFVSLTTFNNLMNQFDGRLDRIFQEGRTPSSTPQFTLDQFLQNPNAVFEVYSNLNGAGVDYMNQNATSNWNALKRLQENTQQVPASSSSPPSTHTDNTQTTVY